MSMEPNVPSHSFARHSQPSPGANSLSSSMATSPDTNSCAVTPDYYQELLKDKRSLQSFPHVFHHVERILETEIGRARSLLYHQNGSSSRRHADDLPEGEGPMVTVQEKVYIPVKENPNYNFVGRLLGPRGMTAKQLETDLDCKIMIRGKGSMRDKKKEDLNRGKPNWEHLSEDLHVLVSVEDHQNRAELKAKRAADEIRVFLEQAVKMQQTGEDSAKRYQLAELAVMKGSYRPSPGQQGARVLNCLQLAGQLQATRASNTANALSMAAAAAAAAQQQQQQQQLNPASFFRLPTSASAAVGLQQQQLAAQQFLLQQGQSQQQLLSGLSFLQPAVSAAGPGGADLSAYLMAAAAAAATSTSSGASTGGGVGGSVDPSASMMSSLMYPGGPAAAAAAGLDLGGQTGPMKGRQHLGSGSGGGVRNHPYTRPGF